MTVSLLQPSKPKRFKAQGLFCDHKPLPTSAREQREFIRDLHDAGITTAILGVNNVVGSRSKLLSSVETLHDFGSQLREAGKEFWLSWWHKPAWENQIRAQQREVLAALNPNPSETLLSMVLDDMEGDTFVHSKGFNPRQHARQISPHVDSVHEHGCQWGITTFGAHMGRLAPYRSISDSLLFQAMAFQDDRKGMGLRNPTTLPGFGTEQFKDNFRHGSWAEWSDIAVMMGAVYKQDFGRVDDEDALGTFCSSVLHDRDSVAYFSKIHSDANPSLVREMALRGPELPELVFKQSPESKPTKLGTGRSWRSTLDKIHGKAHVRVVGDEAEGLVTALHRTWLAQDYRWFDRGDYNLNIFGIRHPDPKLGVLNDWIGVAYKVRGEWIVDLFAGSMDPGPHYEKHQVAQAKRAGGVAIIQLGQYRGAYVLGTHFGYPALVQGGGRVRVHRDGNIDGVADWYAPTQFGRFGINFHPVAKKNLLSGDVFHRGSAGCQVFASIDAHNKIWLPIIRKAVRAHSNSFTYTAISLEQMQEANP